VISFKSIFSRIIFLHVIAVVITAIFLPLVLYWFVKSEADDLQRQAMQAQAESLAHYLSPASNGDWTLALPPALKDMYSQAYGRYAYAVLDSAGRVLFSSLADAGPVFTADARSDNSALIESRHGAAVIAGVNVARQIGDRAVWIQVGENLAHRDVIIDDIVADFFKRVGWITLLILLFLLAIDIVIFRRALRPLVTASQSAKDITPQRADIRLSTEHIPNEILPLVDAINQALDRLEKGLHVQREFTADAAHELRTPLTILRSRIDMIVDGHAAEALHKDIDGMARIVSQLLDIAELETFSLDPSEQTDLHALCAEVAEFTAPLALGQGKSVALSGSDEPVWVSGNAEMLSRAVRNLVENAINHSGTGSTVEIAVSQTGAIEVLDEGPGIAPEDREMIFRRFWRRDRRRKGGAGLGLSIVQRIAEAHQARIKVENRPTGGARFSLSFAETR
jgi:signal transduction histidine kinase